MRIPSCLARANDRMALRTTASELGIPLIPATDRIPDEEDGVAAGAQLGVPLMVKAIAGGAIERVEGLDALADAVRRVRTDAVQRTGDSGVYLERAVDHLRQCGSVLVADQHGAMVHLGITDSSLELDFHTWVEELGEAVVSADLAERLRDAAIGLGKALGWVGVGRVRWAVMDDGGWYLLGVSARLTTGYSLVEQVYGVDLVRTQYRLAVGERLGWESADPVPRQHGVQLRVLHRDATGGRPEGEIRRLELPDGVHAEVGTELGQPANAHTDPLLAKLTVLGPTRHAALVRARAALEELRIEGVATNRDQMLSALADSGFWSGQYDTTTLARLLAVDVPGASP